MSAACSTLDFCGLAVDPQDLLDVARDRGVGLDQDLAGRPGPLERGERIVIPPECYQVACGQAIDPGRGRG